MRTKKNILYSTFIGLNVEIVNSSQHALIGTKGRIVDETKNLIIIEKENGKEVKLPKVACTFRLTLDDGSTVDIEGKRVAFRPHERPKKV